jgi:hypothetical protein
MFAKGDMEALHLQRCLNHLDREAVARCPSCRRFFCRECVTEHEGRILCAGCLRTTARRPVVEAGWWAWGGVAGQFAVGLLVAWIAFYSLGRVLAAMPDRFHQGTIWRSPERGAEGEP